MSDLLTNVRDHLQDADLLDGYTVQFWRWTDSVPGPILLIRRPGTGGQSDHLVQRPDVLLVLIAADGSSASIRAAEVRAHEMLRHFRGAYKSDGVLNYRPMSGIVGPSFLEDGRSVFELNLRCLTDTE